MKFAKRRGKQAPEGDSAAEAAPVTDGATAAWAAAGQAGYAATDQAEAAPATPEVVEGEAVELPYEAPAEPVPAAPAAAYEPPAPVYTPPPPHPVEPNPAARLADSTPHHEPGIRPGAGGAWPEPAFDLAERPEILVGAAFGGGILLALILRRLGH
jgi:hypothetical protein